MAVEMKALLRWIAVLFSTMGTSVAQHAVGGNTCTVAMAEFHSDWERIDLGVDRFHFGTRSLYNYAEWLSLFDELPGYAGRRLMGRINKEVLADVNVLICKTPTKGFLPDEVYAISEFVREGGGLVCVGDHTDIFGMNTYLNDVLRPMGCQLRADAVYEVQYTSGFVFTGDRYGNHAVTRHMERLHGMTGCSLDLTWDWSPLMWLPISFRESANYSVNTFFGDSNWQADHAAGVGCTAAARSFGRGRVVVLGDSTLLSNFSIYLPGVRELAVCSVAWAAGGGDGLDWSMIATILGGCVGVLLVALLRRRGGIGWLIVPLVVSGGLAGRSVVSSVEGASGAGLVEWLDQRSVVYDQVVSRGRLPVWHQDHTTVAEFWAMMIGVMRSGRYYRVRLDDWDEAFDGEGLVLVNPVELSPEYLDKMAAFVCRGGRVVVFGDVLEDAGLAECSARFGVTCDEKVSGAVSGFPFEFKSDVSLKIGRHVAFVGGEPWLWTEGGDVLGTAVCQGLGQISFVGLAADVSDSAIGGTRGFDSWDMYRRHALIMEAWDRCLK